MHIDPQNPNYSSKLMESEQVAIDEERVVGKQFNKGVNKVCASTVKKTNSMLGIKRNYTGNRETIIVNALV